MISTAELQEWTKAEDEDLVLLRRLEQAAVEVVQLGLGFYIGPVAERTEVVRFSGWPLSLANEPVDGTLTTFELWDGSAWTSVDSTSFYLIGGMIYGEGSYAPARMSRFRATYQGGYPAHESDPDQWFAPEDIQTMVKLLVARWFERRGDVDSEIPAEVQAIMRLRARVAI
jgi:hypothetical protein